MATKQIGKLSVVLGANAGPYSAALKQAEKDSKGFTDKQAREEEKRQKKAEMAKQKFIEKNLKAEERQIKMEKAAAEKSSLSFNNFAVGGVIGGAALAVGAAFAGAKSGMDDLMKVDEQARNAGVSIGEFRGAMLAAGPAAAAMEGALTSLSGGLGDLEAGLDSSVTRGLKKLNLDGTADMEAVARALGTLDNPAQKAAAAYEILGDSAKGVMHLLSDGGVQLAKGKDLAERFGLGADGKSVQAIKDAKMNLEAFSTGITNNLALGAAPIVQELSSHFVDLAGFVKGGAKVIAYGGAIAIETWKGLVMIWDVLKIGFQYTVGGIVKGIAWLGDQINWLSEQFEKVSGVSLGIMDTSGLKESGNEWLADAGKNWEGFLDKMANDRSAFAKVDEFFGNVEKRSKQAGDAMTKAPFIDAFAKRFVDLKREIEQANPLQQWKSSLAEIAAFDKQGLFRGNEELKALMTQKAFAGLQGAVQLPQLRQPDAAVAGSREAYSAIVQFQRGDQRLTVQEQLKALQIEANKLQQEQIRIGKEAAEALQKIASATTNEGRDI